MSRLVIYSAASFPAPGERPDAGEAAKQAPGLARLAWSYRAEICGLSPRYLSAEPSSCVTDRRSRRSSASTWKLGDAERPALLIILLQDAFGSQPGWRVGRKAPQRNARRSFCRSRVQGRPTQSCSANIRLITLSVRSTRPVRLNASASSGLRGWGRRDEQDIQPHTGRKTSRLEISSCSSLHCTCKAPGRACNPDGSAVRQYPPECGLRVR